MDIIRAIIIEYDKFYGGIEDLSNLPSYGHEQDYCCENVPETRPILYTYMLLLDLYSENELNAKSFSDDYLQILKYHYLLTQDLPVQSDSPKNKIYNVVKKWVPKLSCMEANCGKVGQSYSAIVCGQIHGCFGSS